MIAFQIWKKIALNFSHRKALKAHSFPSVIWPLVNIWENYLFRDTHQVILILMIPVLSFYHVRGLSKREVTHTHRRNKDNIYVTGKVYNQVFYRMPRDCIECLIFIGKVNNYDYIYTLPRHYIECLTKVRQSNKLFF